jgi:predicted nuclease of restriction endonuclease-like (RecB) superfamily
MCERGKVRKENLPAKASYIAEIKRIIDVARTKAYSAVNYAMVEAYWLIGKRIVEEEQQGKARAEYGKEIIKNVSIELTNEYGKGFSETNIKNFRQFYMSFSNIQIRQAVPDELNVETQPPKYLRVLSWTHYERLIRIADPKARLWYMKEAEEQMWGYRTLDRNISTMYYQRMLASQQKEPVVSEMQEKTANFQKDKLEFIKNPTVLEFLGLPNNAAYTESELEKAIIDHMQQFLLEFGKGFAFVARQKLIRTEIYAISSDRRRTYC